MSDRFLEEAQREVDAMTPGSPSIYRSPFQAKPRLRLVLPRGWRYDEIDMVYVDPRGERLMREFVDAMPDPQRFFAQQAVSLTDILDMAARMR